MKIRIDKVTRLPGFIRSSATYTLVLDGGLLYFVRTGKYIDFDRETAYYVGNGIDGFLATFSSQRVIDKMYRKRREEIEKHEVDISHVGISGLLNEKESFVIEKEKILKFDFNPKNFILKITTDEGRFKFYFSGATNREKVKELVASFA